jgi:glycosyltransferase involved in cell wall biosynthesis
VNASPAVSVCIITYNQAAYIRQAIESAIAQQTSFDFEIVVGDDHSTDATPTILAELERAHGPTLRVLRRDANLGVTRNLAETLQACRARYVALLEGDDYWTDPQKLQLQHDFLESYADHAIVFHRVEVRGEDGSLRRRLPVRRVAKRTRMTDLLERGNFIPTPSVMYRHQIREFPEWFYALRIGDLPLNVMQARLGDIGFIDRVMAVYREHRGGTFSAIGNAQRVEQVVKMYADLNDYLDRRYDRVITGALSYWRAVELFSRGEAREARGYARVRFATPPTNRQRLMAGLMAYAPGLYLAVRKRYPAPL